MYLFKEESSSSEEEPAQVTDLSLLHITHEQVKCFTFSVFLQRWVPIDDLKVYQAVQRNTCLHDGYPLEYDRVMELFQVVPQTEIAALIFSYEQTKFNMEYSLAWNYRDTYTFTSARQLVKRELETSLQKMLQWEKDFYLTIGYNHLDACWDFYEPFGVVRNKFKQMMTVFDQSNQIEKIRWTRHGFVIFWFADSEEWFVFYTSIDVFNFYPIF